MPVYVIAQIAIHDRTEYDKYQAGFPAVFADYQGELLVVSESPTVVEGAWPYTRTVVIKFPTADEARRWYESPAYQAIARHRHAGGTTNAVVVEGFA
jgi:uncharacterized protein (DUF1330 family)